MQLSTNPTPHSTPTLKSNVPTFDSLLQVAKDLGVQSGQGKDTQIKFDLALIEGAYLGTLSLSPDKHGIGRDDATLMSEAYVRARQGAVIFDAKSDAGRKQVSNVRKCIKLGGNPKWGRGQPMQFVQEFVRHWQDCRKDPAKAKKLDDVHNALMRLATAQLKSDPLLSDAERNAYVYKNDPDLLTPVQVLEKSRKTLQRLLEGKVSNCDGYDNSQEVRDCIAKITLRLSNIAKGAK